MDLGVIGSMLSRLKGMPGLGGGGGLHAGDMKGEKGRRAGRLPGSNWQHAVQPDGKRVDWGEGAHVEER